ncbi:MarR family winged helix-turn-helix transcriptional regulator [Williamsia sp.]|uniref:MarR family winged helix-turn-helix transcriptional regulator n=1 Tax=Williamsia sp. TaxID=1872085 RepID=UPI001A1AD7FD|nr:MarR family winged helix-turn-helix transcriptional regulator [Williamsia sp.]MBJ7289712.1 winged helix-turn-helix transcriptional regulator [Williamsia sp.]
MSELRQVFSDLVRVETALWNAVDTRLRADCGLPLGRYESMAAIDRRESCRVNDIAADLIITVGAVSKLVDRIAAAGHCVRRRDPADARSSIIELTDAGRTLLTRAHDVVEAELAARIDGVVSRRALADLASTLANLRQRRG